MIPLPATPHQPGRTPRPDPALFAGLSGPEALAAGLQAFRRGYFWEAHECWERVWAALPPASAEREVMRGAIQLANAGLKHRMGRPAARDRILALATAALHEGERRGARIAGLDPGGLQADLDSFLQDNALFTPESPW